MRFVPVKINELVGRVESLTPSTIGEYIEMNTVCTAKDPTILADSALIEQVLVNLATNARDAMPEGDR